MLLIRLMAKKDKSLFEKHKGVIVSALSSILLNLLKFQAMGGIKGWLIKTLVKEFSEEVYEFIKVNLDHIEIKKVVNNSEHNEDRNEATDDLNDILI